MFWLTMVTAGKNAVVKDLYMTGLNVFLQTQTVNLSTHLQIQLLVIAVMGSVNANYVAVVALAHTHILLDKILNGKIFQYLVPKVVNVFPEMS